MLTRFSGGMLLHCTCPGKNVCSVKKEREVQAMKKAECVFQTHSVVSVSTSLVCSLSEATRVVRDAAISLSSGHCSHYHMCCSHNGGLDVCLVSTVIGK